MTRFHPRAPAAAVALAVLALAGCGDTLRQPTYKVTGRVLMDGKPVPGASIVFHPVDKSKFKWDERPQGKTDPDGHFTLTTYEVGDGAPAGDYQVAIAYVAGEVADDGSDQVRRAKVAVRIPQRYGYAEKSGLTATVESRTTELRPFELTGK